MSQMPVCALTNCGRQFSLVLARWHHRPHIAGGPTLDLRLEGILVIIIIITLLLYFGEVVVLHSDGFPETSFFITG